METLGSVFRMNIANDLIIRAPPTNRGRDQRRFNQSIDQTYEQQLKRGRQRPRTPSDHLNQTTR